MTEAEQARDAAIADVARGAPAEWLAATTALIASFPPGRLFTTDDLWRELGDNRPPEPRAMGAVVKHAAATGLIQATGRYWRSQRATCHARPCAVWERVAPGDTPPG